MEIEMAAAQVITAGSDTLSNVCRSIIYEVISSPRVYKKLLEELDQAGPLPMPTSEAQTKLPYFQACFREVLRLDPPLTWSLPRIAPNEGLILGGYQIPKGTVVGSSSWVTQRDTAVFGDDADQFRPERWLEDNRAQMDKHMLVWGGGTRTCPGRHLVSACLGRGIKE
jgi:cytochrome P450